MLEKIITNSKASVEIQEELEKEILSIGEARYLFYYAYYIKNTKEIERKLLETKNINYILKYLRFISNINYDLFTEKIILLGEPKDLYYAVYNPPILPIKNVEEIAAELMKTNEDKYKFLFFYNYFNYRKGTSVKILNLLQKYLSEEKINLQNCREILENLWQERKEKGKIPKRYSTNCYKGRNNQIPRFIVCHITSDFYKAIRMFYDQETEVSAHFIISREGETVQIVSLSDSSWANGTTENQESDVYYKLSTHPFFKNSPLNANYLTFSIECESIDGSLTEIQFRKLLQIIKQIIDFVKEKYQIEIPIDERHIIGHKDINPIVKTCPGNNFPMKQLIYELKNEIK